MQEIKRYTVIDILRGIAIIMMVAYHALWDIVRIFHVKVPWFYSDSASVFQMSIRWSFILLSGFCWCLSRNKLKRSLIVIAGSVIITLATALFMPKNIIIFGVLSLIGFAMLITIPLDKVFRKVSPFIGLVVCVVLFVITYDTDRGRMGIGDLFVLEIPDNLYANTFTAFFGFKPRGFSSSDYVPVLPWIFMYWMGYFLYRIFERMDLLKFLSRLSFRPLEVLGRHSLIIYMLHQPIVYGVLYLIFNYIV